MRNPTFNYAVYAASVVFEGISWWFGWSAFKRIRGGEAILRPSTRARTRPSFMVLFEDSAALVGIVIAAIATALSTRFESRGSTAPARSGSASCWRRRSAARARKQGSADRRAGAAGAQRSIREIADASRACSAFEAS